MSASVGGASVLSVWERHVPSRFHQQQYLIASALFIVCLSLYCYGPEHSRELLVGMVGIFGGFITGKFTNGFKKPDAPEDAGQKGNVP